MHVFLARIVLYFTSKLINFQITDVERIQQVNMVSGQELNAIQALASRNFFNPPMIEDGTSYPQQPDKKILHLG